MTDRGQGISTQKRRLPVYLIHWNAPDRLAAALAAIHRSDGVSPCVTVIDNASDEGARAHLKRLRVDLDFCLIELGENLGFAGAANVAIRCARASNHKLFVVGSHDPVPQPTCLRIMRDLLLRDPRLGAVGPTFTSHLSDEILSAGGRWMEHRGAIHIRNVDNEPSDGVVEADWLSGTLVLWRMGCLEDIGGYDTDFFAYLEDVDIALRARENGWDIAVAFRAISYWQGTTLSSLSHGYLMTRNTGLLIRKRDGMLRSLAYCVRVAIRLIRPALGSLAFWRPICRRSASQGVLIGNLRGILHALQGRGGMGPTAWLRPKKQ